MNPPKHTPGPWECGSFYYPETNSPGSCEITQTGEMGILAIVTLPRPNRSGHNEGRANARLIAAAPDLLAACEAMLNDNHTLGELSRPVANVARAAIAKATEP